MKNSILTFSLIISILCSCGNSGTNSENSVNETAKITSSSNATCIFDYIDKYDKLLPLDVIQKHYTADLSKAKMKYNKSDKPERQTRDSYIYSWPSERVKTMNFGGGEMNIPIPNEIGIKWLGDNLYKINGLKDPIASFKKFYRTVSQTELDAAMGKADEKISEDKNISKETKNSAMDMAKGLSAGAKYEDVNGFGDAASWDGRDNALIILIGDRTFQVAVSISSENETNKALAMKLAAEVLAKCK